MVFHSQHRKFHNSFSNPFLDRYCEDASSDCNCEDESSDFNWEDTYNCNFSLHVNDVCLRANRKLSVLRSANILSRQTLDLLYKLRVRSVNTFTNW